MSKYTQALQKAQKLIDDKELNNHEVVILQRVSKKKWHHAHHDVTYKEDELIEELNREVPNRVVILMDLTNLEPSEINTPNNHQPESSQPKPTAEQIKDVIDAHNTPMEKKEDDDTWKIL